VSPLFASGAVYTSSILDMVLSQVGPCTRERVSRSCLMETQCTVGVGHTARCGEMGLSG
jgi:hypothetical protein